MVAPAFRPEQFELVLTGEWSLPPDPGIRLNADVASALANGVFANNNNTCRQRNEHWPRETQVIVALGLTAAHGAQRERHGIKGFIDESYALFGIDIPRNRPFNMPTVYRSYMEDIQHVLGVDEIEGYRAKGYRTMLSHPLRMADYIFFRQRQHQRARDKVGEMLITMPRPLEPLLEVT